jgi:glycosyltransferase involved in cell wall biosynthesis
VRADIIVSHLSINWRALPKLISFRARYATTPLVHVEHSYTEAFTALNVPSRTRFYTLLRTAYALFDRVVAVSETQGAWLRARGLVRRQALRVIASCVALERFRALPRSDAPVTRFGAIGRLDRQKGFDLLVEAFKAVPNPSLRLKLFGDGPERAKLQSLADGDPRIRFRGFMASPEAAISSVDAVVMPSRWEAFGLVALEARAAGRPLALAVVDGLQDQIVADTFVVSGHATADWSDAIEALARRDLRGERIDSTAQAEELFANGWEELINDLTTATGQDAA